VSSSLVRELIDAGIHFGHRVSRWNPKMAPYIFGKRNMIHIIDIRETVKGLLRAKKFLTQLVASGEDVLIVGTKRQAKHLVRDYATKVGMHYVAERWLGGTLTNFQTIRSRLARLEELEELEQTGRIREYSKKMIASLLREKRKISRNLEGIRRMSELPGALVIIDPRREHIAVKEAKKMGIPTVCLIDTDGDPDYADIPIPGNDDAIRAIDIVLRELCEAIEQGKRARVEPEAVEAVAAAAPAASRRRVRRTTAGDSAPAAETGAPAAEQQDWQPESTGPSDQPAPGTSEGTPADTQESQAAGEGEAVF